MEWPASLRQTCRTGARPDRYPEMAKSTQRGADERFFLFVLSSGKAVPSALIGKEMEILYFFLFFSGL